MSKISDSEIKDLVFKWADLVTNQTNDLWAISLAVLIATLLILARLHGRGPADIVTTAIGALGWPSYLAIFSFLYLSLIGTGMSLFLSYKVKGSLVARFEDMAAARTWTIPPETQTDSAFQALSFSAGIALFVLAFVLFRKIVGAALVGALKG
jgi:hypothetical protein